MNSVGIVLIIKSKRGRTHQNLMLLNLSLIGIALSMSCAVYWFFSLYGAKKLDPKMLRINMGQNSLRVTGYLIVIVLTADRFIASRFTFYYHEILTEKRVYVILAACWSACLVSAVIFNVVNFGFAYFIYCIVIYPFLDIVLMFLFFVTYGYILRTIKQNRENLNRCTTDSRRKREETQCMKIAGMTIVSFLFCIAIPDIVYAVLFRMARHGSYLVEESIFFIVSMFLVILPIIYIFLQKNFRDILYQLFCLKLAQSRSVVIPINLKPK